MPSLADIEADDGASDKAEDSVGAALILAILASLARLALSNTDDSRAEAKEDRLGSLEGATELTSTPAAAHKDPRAA